MNRRRFVLASGLVAACPALCHERTHAEKLDSSTQATFARQPLDADESDFTKAPGLVQAAFRSFEASQSGFMDIFTGGLIVAAGIGTEFDTLDDASRAIDFLAESLVEAYIGRIEGTPGNTVEASIGRLGDERLGLATTIRLDDDEFFEEVVLGTAFVRKGRYLQVLFGGSTIGPLSHLAQISSDIDSRWPSDDVWDIVPELADMPVGMVLDSEEEYAVSTQDRERESTDDEDPRDADDPDEVEIEAGSLSFSVELRVRGLYLETGMTGDTCSGAGFYDVVDAGAGFTVLDSDTDELLYSTTLSQGTLESSSCAWTIAVLGLPPRPRYGFFVGQKRMGTTAFEDIQQGATIRFEKDK